MNLKQIYYEEVQGEMQLPEITFGPITTRMMVEFSAARSNFHPIHYDKDIARAEGHPDVLVEGPMKLALFDRLMREFVGEFGKIRKLSATYKAIDVPGNTIYIRGKVASKRIEEGGGNVYCTLWAENQKGTVTTEGSAIVTLPFKSKEA